MSLTTLKKLGKNMKDLIPTSMKMASFMGASSNAMGVLLANVVVGRKELRYAFFVIDDKPSYSLIFDRDRIHVNVFPLHFTKDSCFG
jgi:hypothetical protein